jgi:hypothetical protein
MAEGPLHLGVVEASACAGPLLGAELEALYVEYASTPPPRSAIRIWLACVYAMLAKCGMDVMLPLSSCVYVDCEQSFDCLADAKLVGLKGRP